jgi:hypothetical protein
MWARRAGGTWSGTCGSVSMAHGSVGDAWLGRSGSRHGRLGVWSAVGWTVVCPGDGPLVYQLGNEFSSRNNIVPTKFPTSNSICILALRDEGCRRSLR